MFRRPALPSPRRQRGSFAVETALTLPILLGLGFIGTDMHRIGITRSELEQHSGSAALTLAMQSTLTANGLQGIEDISTQDNPDQYELVILNVLQSGKVNWGFKRGKASNLCTIPVSGGRYTGSLPEDQPKADNSSSTKDTSTLSYIIVLQCRSTSDITLAGRVTWPDTLQITSLQRAMTLKPELDETLTQENLDTGLAVPDSESQS